MPVCFQGFVSNNRQAYDCTPMTENHYSDLLITTEVTKGKLVL